MIAANKHLEFVKLSLQASKHTPQLYKVFDDILYTHLADKPDKDKLNISHWRYLAQESSVPDEEILLPSQLKTSLSSMGATLLATLSPSSAVHIHWNQWQLQSAVATRHISARRD